MSAQEDSFQEIDEDAVEAKKEFYELPLEARKIVSGWVLKWYMKTGLKRLGRIMVSFAKERSK